MSLQSYIATAMPLGGVGNCAGSCAADVAAYIIAEFQGSAAEPPTAEQIFHCEAGAEKEADVWRRLSNLQYRNTLRDLVAASVGTAEVSAVMVALTPALDALPVEARPRIEEDLRGTYRRLEQSVYQSHVEAWYALSLAAAGQLTQTRLLPTLVGNCVNVSSGVEVCVRNFVSRFGRHVLRRPLDTTEVDLYSGFYGAFSAHSREAYANVVAGLLNSPYFLYLIEHGAGDSLATRADLSAHELAARLSYHFWNSMPDAQLMAAADDGSLLTDSVYRAQVERLFNHTRTRATVREFYREWLKLENLEPLALENSLTNYQVFAGNNLPSPTLHTDMQNEVLDLLDYGTWSGGFRFTDFFTSQLLFPSTPELAAIYAVPVQAPGVGVLAPAASRPGLLTRAALVATRGVNTRPIMKGVFIRENMLCDEIPPPPDNATANLPELSPLLTTREQVAAITEQAGTSCSFCHLNLINGLGFPTESFDSLGRLREHEMLLDQQGNLLGWGALDLRAAPVVTAGSNAVVNSPAELMNELIGSGKLEACFARHYFRFTFARWEDEQRDGCELETLRSAAANSTSVSDMLKAVALTPTFRSKHFGQ